MLAVMAMYQISTKTTQCVHYCASSKSTKSPLHAENSTFKCRGQEQKYRSEFTKTPFLVKKIKKIFRALATWGGITLLHTLPPPPTNSSGSTIRPPKSQPDLRLTVGLPTLLSLTCQMTLNFHIRPIQNYDVSCVTG